MLFTSLCIVRQTLSHRRQPQKNRNSQKSTTQSPPRSQRIRFFTKQTKPTKEVLFVPFVFFVLKSPVPLRLCDLASLRLIRPELHLGDHGAGGLRCQVQEALSRSFVMFFTPLCIVRQTLSHCRQPEENQKLLVPVLYGLAVIPLFRSNRSLSSLRFLCVKIPVPLRPLRLGVRPFFPFRIFRVFRGLPPATFFYPWCLV